MEALGGSPAPCNPPTTRIARGDTAEEIARLKAVPGGEILAHGGTRFVHSLIRLGLVDQYRLWVLPAAEEQGENRIRIAGRS